jgi:predicted GNAT family acetyltransferase
MWRMALPLAAWSPRPHLGAIRLGMEREAEIRAVYRAGDGGDAFAAFQLAMGYFYGIECDGQLVSVAGVHIASKKYRVGAVGNVCTLPAYRGRGFGAACTSSVVQALLTDGIDTIFLNVEQTNQSAIHIYEKLGFVKHCEFIEGLAHRKP